MAKMADWKIARDANTPSEMLIKLATHKDSYVRRQVAYNSNTPPELLTTLSK